MSQKSLFLLFSLLLLLTDCVADKIEKQAIIEPLQALSGENTRDYITQNSFDYFRELYQIAKPDNLNEIKPFIESSTFPLMLYALVLKIKDLCPDDAAN